MCLQQKVTIKKISKHPMPFCNSRQLKITVTTADGEDIYVPWAQVPAMLTTSSPISKPTFYFDWFWHFAEEGTLCYLWHGKDANCNYLEPLLVS